MLTLVSAIDAPTTLARARRGRRPNPPLPGGAWPAQRNALRNDMLSTVSVPSIIEEERLATVPSNASFSGALASRAVTPDRSPERAATKPLELIEQPTRSPRQANCPGAAKERAHGGDWRLDRVRRGVAVEKPGCGDQADQCHADQRGNRQPDALHSLGHRQ